MNKGDSLAKMTVGWIEGHQVGNDPAAGILRQLMDRKFKRVRGCGLLHFCGACWPGGIWTGSSCITPKGENLYVGLLMAKKKAGATVVDYQRNSFTVWIPNLI